MGWTFTCGATKHDIVEEVLGELGHRVIDYRICSNTLWFVCRSARGEYIGCFLLASDGGFGWGYKDMEESMHPYYYDCPLDFLDLAPVACAAWRDLVRVYHVEHPDEKIR